MHAIESASGRRVHASTRDDKVGWSKRDVIRCELTHRLEYD